MNMISGLGARGAGLLPAIALALLASASHAQPRAATTAYVASRPLMRGQVLTADDITMNTAKHPSPEPRAPMLGWVAKRTIAAGEVLRAPAVAPPAIITTGQQVAVVYREAGIEVRLTGLAANAAAPGERVVVRVEGASRTAGRRIEGVAVSAGLVQIQ